MQSIKKYFKQLSENQINQLSVMLRLYPEWNTRVNVISRKDIDNLEVNHILHSLAIARFVQFSPGTRVIDLGTGGGFPAIPLAMMFPETHFHLVDRIGKKLRVAEDVALQAGIANVTLQHGDIKEVKGTFDFVVSRAVMPLPDMVPLVRRLVERQQRNAIPNGLICLKGGDLDDELRPYAKQVLIEDLATYFDEPFFTTKKLVFLPL
ncbi:MAG: 16S rRNA (guanine(527)-N(7))-methyltransferase RsmG [Muribaculaceae bacterium]|nr:16S rRNA (guanine(527)-N(7))-methyltransferase RsmG [Muribaculaceae bacterium]